MNTVSNSRIIQVEILVIGGGPAGLSAALSASSLGAKVLIVERDNEIGGQLVKQTHKFFGGEKQYAGERGYSIGKILSQKAHFEPNIEIWSHSTVIGIYEDGVVTILRDDKHIKVMPQKIIAATGAAEKFLSFPGNDLPGVYGAGAIQTLMNVDGIRPASRVLMVGAGNIGLIVAYQLFQAGVDVAAVIRRSPTIDGYLVHASKIRRIGIPVLTRHTILKAFGDGKVEGAVIAEVDENKNIDLDKTKTIMCDAICLAVGLSPLTELLWQAGCKMAYISELSGHVPIVSENLETTRSGIYAAGDITGVEEASSAMVEGNIAGISAAMSLGYGVGNNIGKALLGAALGELSELRAGAMGKHIRSGTLKVQEKYDAFVSATPATDSATPATTDDFVKHTADKLSGAAEESKTLSRSILSTGIPAESDLENVYPSKERLFSGPIAIVECFQEIPCDPCVKACKLGAIKIDGDINALPTLDNDLCNGCTLCISMCPGLAIFCIDYTYSDDFALVSIPHELNPVPEVENMICGLDRDGNELGIFKVVRVRSGGIENKTYTISLAVPHDLAMDVRAVKTASFQETPQGNNPIETETANSDADTIICRCEDITLGDIRRFIDEGFDTLDELKRVTRVGMGPCQGRTCRDLIALELSRRLKVSYDDIAMTSFRPPVVPVSLGTLADAHGK